MEALPIEQVKSLSRKAKRRVHRGWWKHMRQQIPGATRKEKRRNWRSLWGKLRTPNK
jgi:hypothetical protein